MPAHYATARRMLGVTENRILGDADRHAEEDGRRPGRRRLVLQDRRRGVLRRRGPGEARAHPDPYFGGEGPPRSSCIGCGGCMVGCRFNAKNTLDKNYLYFAEKRGAKVIAETRVVDVRPLGARRRQRRLRAHHRALDRVVREAAPDAHRAPRRARRLGARHDGPAAAAQAARLAAGGLRPARPRRAHELRVDRRRAVPRQAVRHVEGHRDRLGHPHRSVHAHRGHALLARLRRARPARDDARHRQAAGAGSPRGSGARSATRSGSSAPAGRSASRARR